jgi:hypothetical protein
MCAEFFIALCAKFICIRCEVARKSIELDGEFVDICALLSLFLNELVDWNSAGVLKKIDE